MRLPAQARPSDDREQVKIWSEVSKEKEVIPFKAKKKKKDTPNPQYSSTKVKEQPSINRPLIQIEQITTNKNARDIFKRLFSKYEPNIRSDKNVKISLNEISSFYDALDQDHDPSKGKGGHNKTTLNFQQFGSTMEDQMVIMSHKNYLIPEQIKDIRMAFITARIVPNDARVIQKLKDEGLLED